MPTASERVYESVRQAILAGDYPASTHLTAAGIGERLGVSRTPVREGLRRLHAEGLVNFVSNHGAYVVGYSTSDLADLYDLRASLEPRAAQLAAQRIDHGQIDELAQLCDRMEAAAAGDEDTRLHDIARDNDRFHRIIARAAGSRRLTANLEPLFEAPIALKTFSRYSRRALQRSMNHHRELVSAFSERDSDWAHAAMACHVYSARSTFRVYFANGTRAPE